MLISIPKGVRQTRRLYTEEAKTQGVSLRDLVERNYLTLNRSPLLEQVEAKVRAGVAPTNLNVSDWTPDTAKLLLAVATVVLAVEMDI